MPKYQALFDLIPAPKETAFGRFFKTFVGYRDKMKWLQIEQALKQQNYDQRELQRLYRDLTKQKNELIREQSLLVVTAQRSEDSRTRSLRRSSEGASDAAVRHQERMAEMHTEANIAMEKDENDKYRKALEDHQKVFASDRIELRMQAAINRLGQQRNFGQSEARSLARTFKSSIATGVANLTTPEGAAAIDLMYKKLSESRGSREFADMWYDELLRHHSAELRNKSLDDLRYENYLDSSRGSGDQRYKDQVRRRQNEYRRGAPQNLLQGSPQDRQAFVRIFAKGSKDPLKRQYDTLQERINDLDREIQKVEDKRDRLGSTGGLLDLGNGAFAQNWITENPFTIAPPWVEALSNTIAGAMETPSGQRQVNEMFDVLGDHESPQDALQWAINNQWPPPPGITGPISPERAEGVLEETAIAEEAAQPTALAAYGDTESARGIRDFLAKFEQDVNSGEGLPWNELSKKISELKESGNPVGAGIANSIERSLATLDQTGDMNQFMDDLRNVSASQAEPLVEEEIINRERKEVEQAAEQVEIPSFIKSKLGLPGTGAGAGIQDTVAGLDNLLSRFEILQGDATQYNDVREGAIARLTAFREELENIGLLRDPLMAWRVMSFDERKSFADNLLFLTELKHQAESRNISSLKKELEESAGLPGVQQSLQRELREATLNEDSLIRELNEAKEAAGVIGGIAESYEQVGSRPLPGSGEVSGAFEETQDEAEAALTAPPPKPDDEVARDLALQAKDLPPGYKPTQAASVYRMAEEEAQATRRIEEQLDAGGLSEEEEATLRRDLDIHRLIHTQLNRTWNQLSEGADTDDNSFWFTFEPEPGVNPRAFRRKPLIEPSPLSDENLLENGML